MEKRVEHSDLVAVELGGRQIGSVTLEEERFNQPVPNIELFRDLAADIRQRSALIALKEAEVVTKQPVYDAYAKDLELIRRYHAEFKDCVHAAIRCSVNGISRPRNNTFEQTYQILAPQIPVVDAVQLLRLPHTVASRPLPNLVTELKTEANRAIGRIVKSLADWLQLLSEEELIGLVEWSDVDVCCYSYFKHEFTASVEKTRKREEITVDGSKPWGQQTTKRILRDRTTTTRQIRERHVHHIVNAKLYRITEYRDRISQHVAIFLEAIPASLERHLNVVEGTITTEERHRRLVGESTTTETEVISVYKYSPGVIFGPFNLIGWSADDLTPGVYCAAQRQRMRSERYGRIRGHLFTA